MAKSIELKSIGQVNGIILRMQVGEVAKQFPLFGIAAPFRSIFPYAIEAPGRTYYYVAKVIRSRLLPSVVSPMIHQQIQFDGMARSTTGPNAAHLRSA
jgi:hypothetical protein